MPTPLAMMTVTINTTYIVFPWSCTAHVHHTPCIAVGINTPLFSFLEESHSRTCLSPSFVMGIQMDTTREHGRAVEQVPFSFPL